MRRLESSEDGPTPAASEFNTTEAAGPMSQQARVIDFTELRMTDVESVGGKNSSLGEMISQLAECRRAGAGRFRDHRVGLPRIPRSRAA